MIEVHHVRRIPVSAICTLLTVYKNRCSARPVKRDRLRLVKDAVVDTLKDQNGGTPVTELRERVIDVHYYPSEKVRKAIWELVDAGTLKIDRNSLITRG